MEKFLQRTDIWTFLCSTKRIAINVEISHSLCRWTFHSFEPCLSPNKRRNKWCTMKSIQITVVVGSTLHWYRSYLFDHVNLLESGKTSPINTMLKSPIPILQRSRRFLSFLLQLWSYTISYRGWSMNVRFLRFSEDLLNFCSNKFPVSFMVPSVQRSFYYLRQMCFTWSSNGKSYRFDSVLGWYWHICSHRNILAVVTNLRCSIVQIFDAAIFYHWVVSKNTDFFPIFFNFCKFYLKNWFPNRLQVDRSDPIVFGICFVDFIVFVHFGIFGWIDGFYDHLCQCLYVFVGLCRWFGSYVGM